MRATYHCGRNGSAKHNDRNFDLSKAEHINPEKTQYNFTAHYYKKTNPELTFEEAEYRYYKEHYNASLEATNERYRKHYMPQKCRTIKDLLTNKKSCPEEVILQVGKMSDNINPKLFAECVGEFNRNFSKWAFSHGNHVHTLDFSAHFDESSPHIHWRRCFDYVDNEGNLRLGQDKALQAMGIERPDPNRPTGRFNNRKMAFDAIVRGIWQDALKSRGLDIEITPLPSRRNLKKEEYIDAQIQVKSSQLEQLNEQIQIKQHELDVANNQVKWTQELREKQLQIELETR